MDIKVAICQPAFVLGGRLRVVIEIIKLLNDAGITPTLVSNRFGFEQADLQKHYSQNVQFKIQKLLLPRIPKLDGEFNTLFFNKMLKQLNYTHLINTSNSLQNLPKQKPLLSYLFFPRKARIYAPLKSIHDPNSRFHKYSFYGIQRMILRKLYRRQQITLNHKLVCMTKFTKQMFLQGYNHVTSPPIIYPPVDLTPFWQEVPINKEPTIVTLGRFSFGKRQIEQIKLAKQLPQFHFHIIGFKADANYFDKCERIIQELKLTNVTLHPNASHVRMIDYLQGSTYFLHTLLYEPFGITAVQAIAAGCLPIVHNSGGQIETVPTSDLRYDTLDDVPHLLKRIQTKEQVFKQQLLRELQEHIQENFTTLHFQKAMTPILEKFLCPQEEQVSFDY